MKIITIVTLPDELASEWFQHMRDFDVKHTGKCEFTALAHAPDRSTEELREFLNVQPPFQFGKEIKG
jgi:hypothetical protein